MPVDPWERLDGETPPAWRAFTTYRDMGTERSHAKVAQELGKSKPLLSGWSRRWSWVQRCAAYDAELDRQWVIEAKAMRRRAAKRNATTSALAMQKVGTYLLDLEPGQLDPNTATRMADVFSRVERVAIGGDELVSAGSTGPSQADLDATAAAMTDEERRAELLMLHREIQARLAEHEPEPTGPVVADDDVYAED